MINVTERINAFHQLGREILQELIHYNSGKKLFGDLFDGVLQKAYLKNNWFTPENQIKALEGILLFLDKKVLTAWTGKYFIETPKEAAKVAVVMAGNIPMVGFHDFLSVLISGHTLIAKLSSDDDILLPYFAEKLTEIEPAWKDKIIFEKNKLQDYDAVIATGSNNTSRYFEFYFSSVPHIIRKNRNSVAVITGKETEAQLKELSEDVFSYFGLGCRNVSKLYLPEGYDINKVFNAFYDKKDVIHHHKYANNYNYNRTIYLMREDTFYDNGFLLLRQSDEIYSPVGTVNFSYYQNIEEVEEILKNNETAIQCVAVADKKGQFSREVFFGETQHPKIDEYADGLDTMEFLTKLTLQNA